MPTSLRVYELHRNVAAGDEPLGRIADVVVFDDGVTVLHFVTEPRFTEIYPTEETMRAHRLRSGKSTLIAVTTDGPVDEVCPDDPAHLLRAHAPGGAWYGVGHGGKPSPWRRGGGA